MFTRCPHCQTTHALSASLVSHARGQVCCGNCNKKFDALRSLFDHWPESGTVPAAVNEDAKPPVLGQKSSEPDGKDAPESPRIAPEEVEPSPSGKPVWIAAFVVLLLITIANAAWTFREPLLDKPELRSLLERTGLFTPSGSDVYRDVSKLHLVSRDLHKHPSRAGLLVLSITFVNRADREQPYPNIELGLKDGAGDLLALREFLPSEYLPPGTTIPDALAPDIHVPVLLEFADPGAEATGFELNFR
jgi:predicted Zn finger-like uncharacterized protein